MQLLLIYRGTDFGLITCVCQTPPLSAQQNPDNKNEQQLSQNLNHFTELKEKISFNV